MVLNLKQPAHIIGIGTAVPPHALNQRQAADLVATISQADDAQRIRTQRLFSLGGIDSRHSSILGFAAEPEIDDIFIDDTEASTASRMKLYQTAANHLACEASKEALESSSLQGSDITHLIVVTCTGFCAPGTDYALIQGLELRPTVERTLIGYMGCHGAINALRVARSIVLADARAKVLLCAVEICSLHISNANDSQAMMANSLFSDGAAAVVIGTSERPALALGEGAALLVPDSKNEMSWNIGDNGFSMQLSSQIPNILRQQVKAWVEQLLRNCNLEFHEVEHWIIHPGGSKIVSSVRQALELSDRQVEASLEILNRYGNMSSATVLFILEKQLQQKLHGTTALLGFGPGLFCEGIILR